MGQMWRDTRYAVRRLLRSPVFSLGAIAIVAVAIGANTAVFVVVNQLLFKPPPFESPERVVNVYQDSDDGEPSSSSFPAYLDMAALEGVFTSVAATSPAELTLDTGDGTQTVATEFTTASYLSTIGRDAFRGRWFDPSMDVVGAGSYAVVSHFSWVSNFGSDPDIVGRTVRLNGQPVEVIGIGPEGYNGVGGFVVTDFWLSISSVAVGGSFRVGNLERREDHWYDVKARLADGVTAAGAQQAVDVLALRLAEEFPELNEGRDITVFPTTSVRIHPEIDAGLFSAAGVLSSIVLLILVLACTNLGSLLLIRGVSRIPEVAVRRALGAAPRSGARLFLVEAVVLSVSGGLAGLLLARWVLPLVASAPLPGPLAGGLDLSWDWRVVGFSTLLMLATGVFFGVAPSVQSLKTDVAAALRDQRDTMGGRRNLSRLRNALVSVQVAASLVLVVAAGVMVQSLVRFQDVDPGVDTRSVAFIQTDFTQAGLTAEDRAPLLRSFVERLSGLPGVDGVAMTSRLPVHGGGTTTTVVEGSEPPAGTGSVELDWALVSPEYFRTVGMEMVDGRGYVAADQGGDEAIVIVNETAANRFWGGQSPLGRRIRPQARPDDWTRVVGVVADSRVRSLAEPPTPVIYYLMGASGVSAPYVTVHVATDPASVLGSLRSELRALNPALPIVRMATLESHVQATFAAPRLSAGLLGLFSLLALCLASVGVYSIVSFSVEGRRREVGIRVALGAERAGVVWMVVRDVMGTVVLGLLAGLAIVVLASPTVQGLLFGVSILSFQTLATALVVMGTAVGAASLLPAWRAARADPVEALRE